MENTMAWCLMHWTLGKVWDSICYILGWNTFLPQCLSSFTQSQKVGLQWILREAWWKVGGGGEERYNVALQSCNRLASCSGRGGGTKRPSRFKLSMEPRISSNQMSLLALVHTLLNNSFYLNYNHSCYEENILWSI